MSLEFLEIILMSEGIIEDVPDRINFLGVVHLERMQ